MAIRTSNKTIGDFGKYHKKSLLILMLFLQLAATFCIAIGLHVTDTAQANEPIFWLLLSGILLINTTVVIILYKAAASPLYDILAALIHKSGELSTTTPPNPSAKKHNQTGFKAILEAIYSSQINNQTSTGLTGQSDLSLTIEEAFSHINCGIAILDSNKQIISHSAAVPIAFKQDGTKFLPLNFINEIDIETWVDESDSNTINAEKRWQRISTDLRYFKKQQFFDIIASYEKGAKAETVVLLIEQSARYSNEEEDLNFIAFAAHELRGPITIIRGYLDVLGKELSDRLKNDEPELFNRLTVSANRLSSYVNNILNVAKLDRHHLRVYLYEDTIKDIYHSIAYDVELRASAQRRLLNVDIPENLPTVAADRGSIGEVISNLLDNAIKYSHEGGVITLKAEKKGDFIEISVTDTGIGMPASVVSNLFQKFYRSHRSRESVSGSGIGLYICKAFVESHGGSISVRSRDGEGSTFTFTLPTYASVADKLLEDGQLNKSLIRQGGGWIKNHAMYRE